MSKKPIDQLGELQRVVLEALWELGGGTVQDVVKKLSPKRKPAYTTVLTTLQNLTKAGWVKPEKSGRAYVYQPTGSREQAGGSSIVAFIRRAFDGKAHVMLETLIEQENLSAKELEHLKKLIDKKRRERKK